MRKRIQRFWDNLMAERPSHFPPPFSIIIALSGGADSLVLLHILSQLFRSEDLIIVHVNHQLRPSANDDAKFIQETAVSYQIPCHIKTVDIAQLAAEQNLTIEEAGRMARYQFFAEVAEKTGAKLVATGHHADDQAETVLMHLLRGSGLSGLRGIQPISDFPVSSLDGLLLIRPFLTTTRAEIEAYCQQHNLTPIHDETNKDTKYFRNRIRHELLPLLAQYNPKITTRLNDLATTVSADYALLDELMHESWTAVLHQQTAEYIQLKREEWLQLPLSLKRSILRFAVQQLRPLQIEIGFATIEAARELVDRGESGLQSSLPGDLTLVVGYDWLTITAVSTPIPHDLPQLISESTFHCPMPGQASLVNNWQLTVSVVNPNFELIENNRDSWCAYLDFDAITGLNLRGRKAGERMQPLGLAGKSTKLKKVMINCKIPVQLRPFWPIVTNEKDEIVWVVGHQLDERFKVTAVSTQAIKLECKKI